MASPQARHFLAFVRFAHHARSRTLAAVAALALLSSGCTRTCKSGTVLLQLTFDSATSDADQLVVDVSVDGTQAIESTNPKSDTSTTGTMQVDFPNGYPGGHMLTVSIAANKAGRPVGSGKATFALANGCTAYALAIAGGAAPGDMATNNNPMPKIVSMPDIVGFPTKLDGSGSTDPLGMPLTLAWSFQQVPAGSTVTAASLSSASAAKPSFEPDFGGDYQVTLTATTPDQRSGQTTATVTVPTVPIFHYRSDYTATTSQMAAAMVRSDGTGARFLHCPFSQDGGINFGNDPHQLGFGISTWDGPSGGKAAFLVPTSLTSMTPPELHVGDANSDCMTAPPPRVDANMFGDHTAIQMRFSPDGTRLAYIDMPFNQTMPTYRLVTVSADGTGPKHTIVSGVQLGFLPPFWIDNSTVGWIESSGSGGDVYKAPDQIGAGQAGSTTRTTLLHCDPTVAGHLVDLNQAAVSPFGLIVAGSTGARGGAFTSTWSPMNLYRMTAGNCSTTDPTVTQVLDSAPSGEPYGGEAWDFQLSADGQTVLYSSTHGQGLPDGSPTRSGLDHDLYVVPSDGSSMPRKLAGDPGVDDIEPRWVAGGRQIVWTQAGIAGADLTASEVAGALLIANGDGTHVRRFQPTIGGLQNYVVDTGMSRAFECSGAPGSAAAGAGTALFALVLLALGVIRRRA